MDYLFLLDAVAFGLCGWAMPLTYDMIVSSEGGGGMSLLELLGVVFILLLLFGGSTREKVDASSDT